MSVPGPSQHHDKVLRRLTSHRGERVGEASHPGPSHHAGSAQDDPLADVDCVDVRDVQGVPRRLTPSFRALTAKFSWVANTWPERSFGRQCSTKSEALLAWLMLHGDKLADGEMMRVMVLWNLVADPAAETAGCSDLIGASTQHCVPSDVGTPSIFAIPTVVQAAEPALLTDEPNLPPTELDVEMSDTVADVAVDVAATTHAAGPAVASDHAAGSAEPMDPPAPPVISGSVACPFCPRYRTRGSTRGLIRHVNCAHAGRLFDARARALFCALERGLCPTGACGCLRSFGAGACSRCHSTEPPRALVEGDRVPSAALEGGDAVTPPPQRRPAEAEIPVGDLPDDFLERIRRLSSQTIVHIPVSFRSRAAKAMAATLLGVARGCARGNMLEQGRSKLLYGPVPRGFNTRTEMATRFSMWEDGLFSELLLRAEAQAAFRLEDRQRRRGGGVGDQRATRAKALARAGAYRRAVVSLTSEVALLSVDDQRSWAASLLPRSTRPLNVLATPAPESDDTARDSVSACSALVGVRFGALSAAGPSGARPEHVRDAIRSKPRAVANQLARAISLLHATAMSGRLAVHSRWILDSKLVFLRKKAGPAPRPIRVGELWRRIVAKKAAHGVRGDVKSVLLRARQFGVAIPGGADALVHFRTAVEEGLQADGGPALVLLDLDLKNAFPTFEWDAIREAVSALVPDIAAWTAWCHESPARVLLPSGEWVLVDRGAEQGDPLGSLYCGLTLVRVMGKVRARMDVGDAAFFDMWYMDDGQVLIDPGAADLFLQVLDEELNAVGASRGSGEGVKSVARLVGSEAACDEAGVGWITERIRDTCKLPGPNAQSVGILGVDIADGDAQFRETCGKVASTRAAIASVGDAATELILTRMCGDACKITHLLRAHGVNIPDDALKEFDDGLATALATSLAGPLHDEALCQATLGVRDGGLGVRQARHTLAPAALASRVQARPLVLHLANEMRDMDLAPAGIMQAFDAPALAAEDRLRSELSPAGLARLDGLLADARVRVATEFQALMSGRPPPPGATRVGRSEPGHSLVQLAGGEDPEWDHEAQGLQHELCCLVDAERGAALVASLEVQGRWSDVRRLRCLRDPSTSHDWLWSLNPVHGPIVPASDFALATRIRLGASLTDEPFVCPRCSHVVGRTAYHGLCCANPQATHGHYEVRDHLLNAVRLADPAASTEEPELIASRPALRPADIFSSAAIPGGMAALDVGITSPDATGAGADCTEAMWRQKRSHYADHAGELRAIGVTYVPMVLSCYGRWHAESAAALDRVMVQASRRLGIACHRPLLRRARAAIGVAVWRRAAAMVRACLPKPSREELALLFGEPADDVA